VDVNVTTRNKVMEEQMFKDKEPRKVKSATNWEKEKWLEKSMVEKFNKIKKHKPK
jgi:hypothetical protein